MGSQDSGPALTCVAVQVDTGKKHKASPRQNGVVHCKGQWARAGQALGSSAFGVGGCGRTPPETCGLGVCPQPAWKPSQGGGHSQTPMLAWPAQELAGKRRQAAP